MISDIFLLDAIFPIALITLGEEYLDFDSYKSNKKLLSELKNECHEIIKILEEEKYYPIPKKFLFTPSYTEENGLLTPTKKTKVMKVLALYEKAIKKLEGEKEWLADNIYNGIFNGSIKFIDLYDKYKKMDK